MKGPCRYSQCASNKLSRLLRGVRFLLSHRNCRDSIHNTGDEAVNAWRGWEWQVVRAKPLGAGDAHGGNDPLAVLNCTL